MVRGNDGSAISSTKVVFACPTTDMTEGNGVDNIEATSTGIVEALARTGRRLLEGAANSDSWLSTE